LPSRLVCFLPNTHIGFNDVVPSSSSFHPHATVCSGPDGVPSLPRSVGRLLSPGGFFSAAETSHMVRGDFPPPPPSFYPSFAPPPFTGSHEVCRSAEAPVPFCVGLKTQAHDDFGPFPFSWAWNPPRLPPRHRPRKIFYLNDIISLLHNGCISLVWIHRRFLWVCSFSSCG